MPFCASSESLACVCAHVCGIENVHVVLIKMGKFFIFLYFKSFVCDFVCVYVCVRKVFILPILLNQRETQKV